MNHAITSQQEIKELQRQAMDIRAMLVREWDVDTHIELTTRLFAIENRVERAVTQRASLQA